MKELSGDDLLCLSDSDVDAEAEDGVDDRAGTWPCTEIGPAVESATSKPAHLELLLGLMAKDEEV